MLTGKNYEKILDIIIKTKQNQLKEEKTEGKDIFANFVYKEKNHFHCNISTI